EGPVRGIVEQIAAHPFDRDAACGSGSARHRGRFGEEIDAGHMQPAGGEPDREAARATADIERARAGAPGLSCRDQDFRWDGPMPREALGTPLSRVIEPLHHDPGHSAHVTPPYRLSRRTANISVNESTWKYGIGISPFSFDYRCRSQTPVKHSIIPAILVTDTCSSNAISPTGIKHAATMLLTTIAVTLTGHAAR